MLANVFFYYSDRIEEIKKEQLLNFLKTEPQPVPETRLLREFLPESRQALADGVSLELFRYHFILYHHLYKLSEELEASGSEYVLFIRTINVYLLQKPVPGFCRYFNEAGPGFCGVTIENPEKGEQKTSGSVDPPQYCSFHRNIIEEHRDTGTLDDVGMREYYLNLENMEAADEQTLKMWEEGIFTYAASHKEIDRSLEILGLSADFTLQRLKNRYRYLCKEHHPDTAAGKEASSHDFSTIQHAYKVLLAWREREAR